MLSKILIASLFEEAHKAIQQLPLRLIDALYLLEKERILVGQAIETLYRKKNLNLIALFLN